jgi:PadR family transcriptional regulator PadR
MRGESLKGHLDLLLLAAVRRRPAHGYAIAEALRARSGGTLELPEGTIYPALHRLEESGLLSSDWSTEAGRRRRVYQLTEKGRGSLEERRKEWRQLADIVARVLRRTSWSYPV